MKKNGKEKATYIPDDEGVVVLATE